MMTQDLALPAGVRLVRLTSLPDERGGLAIGELTELIPFECKRIFMIYDVPPGAMRGEHAHRECHQLLIATSGSVRVEVDDGMSKGEIVLDDPAVGLHLPPLTWGVQKDYSPDCTLLVLASHPYDAAEYVRDYSEFRALTEARR